MHELPRLGGGRYKVEPASRQLLLGEPDDPLSQYIGTAKIVEQPAIKPLLANRLLNRRQIEHDRTPLVLTAGALKETIQNDVLLRVRSGSRSAEPRRTGRRPNTACARFRDSRVRLGSAGTRQRPKTACARFREPRGPPRLGGPTFRTGSQARNAMVNPVFRISTFLAPSESLLPWI